MLRRNGWLLVALSLAAMLLVWPGGEALSQSVREVFVTNFPKVQEVTGELAIKGPVHLARSTAFRDITVPPVARGETTRLIDAGLLTVEGFPEVALSLHGLVKGDVGREGTVGVILIPDEPTIGQAFREQGLMHFALETISDRIVPGNAYFASSRQSTPVAFGRYRILLYNTTDKTVNANVFVYLTS